MTLTNMRSQDTLTAQFNPNEVEGAVAASYARLGVLGMSHEQLQSQFRQNQKWPFVLMFDRLSGTGGSPTFNGVHGFLDACTLGSGGAQDIAGGGPPDVLWLWPGVLQLIVRVTSFKAKILRVSNDGMPTLFQFAIDAEESRSKRLTAEDAKVSGLFRAGA